MAPKPTPPARFGPLHALRSLTDVSLVVTCKRETNTTPVPLAVRQRDKIPTLGSGLSTQRGDESCARAIIHRESGPDQEDIGP